MSSDFEGSNVDMEQERAAHEEWYEKMKTPEGMREVVAGTMYGKGNAKCRCCGKVVAFDISDREKVDVEEVTIYPRGNHLVANPQPRQGFKFSMQCPNEDSVISLGEFFKGIGLDHSNLGDNYTTDGPAKGYSSELSDAYRKLGEANAHSRKEDPNGVGFLDKYLDDTRKNYGKWGRGLGK